MPEPLVVINAVGLTPRWLPHAPRLAARAARGWQSTFREVSPAVTCTAQATLLTGALPARHGIVANGWLYRDTQEVRFWQQSNRLIEAEPLYATARRRAAKRDRPFRCAKFFLWFNQGAAVDLSATPKPHYGIDGDKRFDIATTPVTLGHRLKEQIGDFPFQAFWGPASGIRSTQWIAAAAALTLLDERPDLTLVYLPHLDYEPQRRGPSRCDMPGQVADLDAACGPLLDAADAVGARLWVISEYGHCDVDQPIYLNRALREAGLLQVRSGPFGEQLDTFGSRAFAVCDHQHAHVYVAEPADLPRVVEVVAQARGVEAVYRGDERSLLHLNHRRAGEVIAVAGPRAWFAYPFWIDDRRAPDYARCVAIHHKPGFDPCELFVDPTIRWPRWRVMRRLAAKSLGLRMKMDIVPLDAAIVGGSHGRPASDDLDRPIWIGDGPAPRASPAPMTEFRDAVLVALGLPD